MRKRRAWQPEFTITPAAARWLMEIEAARAVIESLPLPAAVAAEVRRRARVRATHYSTRIEGNRLTLEEAEQVIEGKRTDFRGRERDVTEVRNYWRALLRVEEWAAKKAPLTEDLIRRLHAAVEKGPRSSPSPYREGQNVIRDSASGTIIYLPPEAKEVPVLMADLVEWTRQADKGGLPIPIIAALIHYQFVTIHPFYDGNGRTARLLASFILHRGGYGLGGSFSLEEHHARDLEAYYRALMTHPHYNYYEGRAEADLTSWLEYFVEILAGVFVALREETQEHPPGQAGAEPTELRQLDHRARVILGLFKRQQRITARDVAGTLGLSERMARLLIEGWVRDGWLVVIDPARRSRAYGLSATYRQLIGNALPPPPPRA